MKRKIILLMVVLSFLSIGNSFSLNKDSYEYFAAQIDRFMLFDTNKSVTVVFKSKPQETFQNVIFIKHDQNLLISSLDGSRKEYSYPLGDISSILDAKTKKPVSPVVFKINDLFLQGVSQYQLNNDARAAAELFKKVVALDSNSGVAYHNLGVCFERQELFDDAKEAFKKYITLSGNHKSPDARRIYLLRGAVEISDAKERDAVFGSIMAAITNTIGKRSDYTITVPNVHDALYESLGPEKPRHKDVAYSLVIEGSADTAGTIKLNIWLSPEKKTARAIMGTITGRIDGIASRVQECLEALLKKTGQSGDIAADSFSYEDEPVAIYTVKTTDGEDVVFKMTFTGIEDVEDKLEAPFIKNITVIPPEPSVDGSKKVSVRSREGKLVHFETFVKAGRVEKIIVDTDAPVGSSGEYSEVLHIESLKGHSISVTFIWKDPKVFKIKISPDINPFGPIEAANL